MCILTHEAYYSYSIVIANGKMLEPGNLVDDPTIKASVEKAIFAHLIPEAWSLSNEDINPFIVDAQVPCGTVNPPNVLQYLQTVDVGNQNWVCTNGGLYYMFQVTGQAAYVSSLVFTE
jgi:hypothetical protein